MKKCPDFLFWNASSTTSDFNTKPENIRSTRIFCTANGMKSIRLINLKSCARNPEGKRCQIFTLYIPVKYIYISLLWILRLYRGSLWKNKYLKFVFHWLSFCIIFFVVKKSTISHGNGNLGGQTVSDLKRNEIHQHIWIKVYSNTWNIQRSINYIALSARLYFACACSSNINKMARVKCFNGI